MAELGKQVVGGVAGVIAFVVAGAAVRHLFEAKQDVASMAVLSKTASDLNKQLPMSVDKETELVSTLGLEGVFVYNYRLVNKAADEVDAEILKTTLQPGIKSSACTTPATRDTFLKSGVTLRYTYADKDRKFLTSLDITPKDCGF